MALEIIRRTRSKDYVVFSDTLSSLQAIESCKVENPLILKIMKDHNQLINLILASILTLLLIHILTAFN